MRETSSSRKLSRREFLKLSSLLLSGVAVNRFIPKSLGHSGEPSLTTSSKQVSVLKPDIHLAVCDGWISLPGRIQIPRTGINPPKQYIPEIRENSGKIIHNSFPNKPEAGQTTYIYGFIDVTGISEKMIHSQKMNIRAAPTLFWFNQEKDIFLSVSNLGLPMYPDEVHPRTLHWHGIRNTYTVYVDELRSSLDIPTGQTLTVQYKLREPGTYMYHGHFEQTEHMFMSLAGLIFITPIQDGNTVLYPSGRYAYNDGDGSTGFDREFALILTDVRSMAHWKGAHLQLSDQADFEPPTLLLNGRIYPDTLVNAQGLEISKLWEIDGTMEASRRSQSRPDLRHQPLTSLVEANSGERILLRFANLSYQQQDMTIAGLKLKVVGRNATLLRGQDGTDLAYETNTVSMGIGQSCDVIIKAPEVTNETKFLLYNRLQKANGFCYGGQMTEIRIHPTGRMAKQAWPNTNPYL